MSDANDLDFAQVIKQSFDASSRALRAVSASSLVPEAFDTIEMSYTGDNLTEVVYKADGVTVASLALAYSGDKLVSVTRS